MGAYEFGHQSILLLSSLHKRINRLLPFDPLMLSHNGILIVSSLELHESSSEEIAALSVALIGALNLTGRFLSILGVALLRQMF